MSTAPTTAPATTPAFTWPVRIYWEDTDAGGVVYYANYLKFCERARTEWLRSLGLDQQRLAERDALLFVVSSAQVRYLAPARLDDELSVSVSVVEVGGASLELLQDVNRCAPTSHVSTIASTLLARVQVRVACVQAGSLKPRRLPAAVLQAIAGRPPSGLRTVATQNVTRA